MESGEKGGLISRGECYLTRISLTPVAGTRVDSTLTERLLLPNKLWALAPFFAGPHEGTTRVIDILRNWKRGRNLESGQS